MRRDGERPRRRRVSVRYRHLPLFWKILTPFVLLLLLVSVAGAYLVVRDLAGRSQRDLDRDLFGRSITARAAILDTEFSLLESVRFAANLQGLPDAVEDRDAARTADLLSSVLAIKERLDLLVATGTDGVGLVEIVGSGERRQVSRGHPWEEAPVFSDVLGVSDDALGGKGAGILRFADVAYVAVGAPVLADDEVVGVVVSGVRVQTLVAELARRSSAAVAVLDTSGVVLARSGGFRADALAAVTDADVRPSRTRTVRGPGSAALLAPLQLGGRAAATVAVQLSTEAALSPVRGVSARLAALLAVAIAAVVGIGVLLSRSITRRLQPLVETNRALGRGDLAARAAVEGRDEIGELAEGFNEMAGRLQASYEELEMRVEERTEELERLYDDFVRATRSRTELLAGITHDFRTPLFAIVGHANTMRDPGFRPRGSRWRKEFGDTLFESGQYLLQLVNDLLDHAELEVGRADVSTVDLRLSGVIADMRDTIVNLAESCGLHAALDVPDTLRPVSADPTRLRQIVLNLVSNAVKYTPEGGRITLGAADAGDHLEVSVSDTGVGIPEEVGDRVFEPFYRVPGSHTQKGQASSGLGLSLTKRLVEAHGGRIRYESSSAGTTFVFTLRYAEKGKRKKRAGATSRVRKAG